MARTSRVQPGLDADLAVFDPKARANHATCTDPIRPMSGLTHLPVAGGLVIHDGDLDPDTRPRPPDHRAPLTRHGDDMTDDMSRYIHDPGPKETLTKLRAAVSSDSAIVNETMLAILERGGNAVDAGIAGALVQAAVEPFMTNHTGTVTMLLRTAEGGLHCLDSAGTFPPGLPPFKPVPQGHGPYAAMPPSACIPGFMPGLKAAHERFATMPWADLCADAIRWAEEGHPVSSFEYEVNTWTGEFSTYFPSGREFYLPEGRWVPVGQRFRHPAMAETLSKVAEHGPDWMISGGWAQQFVDVANEMGWAITMDHMVDATPPRWDDPYTFQLGEHTVASLAPPQVQGVFLGVVLGILEALDIASVEPMSAEYLYLMGSALAVGNQTFGFTNDPHFFDNATDVLADPDWHAMQARLIRSLIPRTDFSEHARLTGAMAAGGVLDLVKAGVPSTTSVPEQPPGSCELSVVDEQGNWLQMMDTLQSGGIPGMVVGGIPMVGSHATFGTPGSPIDTWLNPGVRMRSIIGNTMVLRDGEPVLQLGTPGNVHCTVPQVLNYWHAYGMDPYEATSMPRMSPLSGRTVVVEDRVADAAQEGLKRMGLGLRVLPPWDYHMGSFQMCYRDRRTGALSATADPRRCGLAGGLPAQRPQP